MNKLTLLTLALVAFAFNASAESTTENSKEHKYKKERMDRSQGGENNAKMNGQRNKGKHMCAEKCNLSKEKITSCRKKLGLKKGDKGKGKCLSDSQKTCMKSCMKNKKGSSEGKMSRRDMSSNENGQNRTNRKKRNRAESTEE